MLPEVANQLLVGMKAIEAELPSYQQLVTPGAETAGH